MTVVTQKGNRLPFQLTRYSYSFPMYQINHQAELEHSTSRFKGGRINHLTTETI